MRKSQSHNSSSSSILVSRFAGGMLLSELPLSFCAPRSACPKLFRTPSSNPGKEARCFLNGEPTVPSVVRSGTDDFTVAEDEASPFASPVEVGAPEIGDPEPPRAAGDVA